MYRKTQKQIREAWQGYTKNRNEFHSLTQINYTKETQEALEIARAKLEPLNPVYIKGLNGRVIYETMWRKPNPDGKLIFTPAQLEAYEEAMERWKKND